MPEKRKRKKDPTWSKDAVICRGFPLVHCVVNAKKETKKETKRERPPEGPSHV